MKFEYEILEADLEDRKILSVLSATLKSGFELLSEFGKNTLQERIIDLQIKFEALENEWLHAQRARVLNKFSETLNESRQLYPISSSFTTMYDEYLEKEEELNDS